MKAAVMKPSPAELPEWINREDELSQLRKRNAEQERTIRWLMQEEPQEPLSRTEKTIIGIGVVLGGVVMCVGIYHVIVATYHAAAWIGALL